MPYCSDCDREFPHNQALIQHHANSSSHGYCKPCGRVFTSRVACKQHWQASDAHRYTYDEKCEILFESREDRWIHKKDDSSRHPYLCIPCRLEYSLHEDLQKHFQTAAEHKYTYCQACDSHYESREQRWTHVKSSPNHPHVCIQCRLDFRGPSGASNLQEHYETKEAHKDTYCKTCKELFDSQDARLEHIKSRKDMHPYTCFPCGREFKGSQAVEKLRHHLETEEAHKHTYCRICKRDFLSASNLREVSKTITIIHFFLLTKY